MDQRDHGDEQPETASSGYTINDCSCGVNDQQAGEHHSPLCAGYTGTNMSMTEAFHPDELQQLMNDPSAMEKAVGQIASFFGLVGGNDASDQKSQ